jgi:hypothetical protein
MDTFTFRYNDAPSIYGPPRDRGHMPIREKVSKETTRIVCSCGGESSPWAPTAIVEAEYLAHLVQVRGSE